MIGKNDKEVVKDNYNAFIEAFSNILINKLNGHPESPELLNFLVDCLKTINTIPGHRRNTLRGLLYIAAYALRPYQAIEGLPGDYYQEMVSFLEKIYLTPQADRLALFDNPLAKNLLYYAFFKVAEPKLWTYLENNMDPADKAFIPFLKHIFQSSKTGMIVPTPHGYYAIQAQVLNGMLKSNSVLLNSILEIARTCNDIAKNLKASPKSFVEAQKLQEVLRRIDCFAILYSDCYIFEKWLSPIYELVPRYILNTVCNEHRINRIANQLALPHVPEMRWQQIIKFLADYNFLAHLDNSPQTQQVVGLVVNTIRYQTTESQPDRVSERLKKNIYEFVKKRLEQLKLDRTAIHSKQDINNISTILLQNFELAHGLVLDRRSMYFLAASAYHLLKLNLKYHNFKNAELIAYEIIRNQGILPKYLSHLAELALAIIKLRAALKVGLIPQSVAEIAISELTRQFNIAKSNQQPAVASPLPPQPLVFPAPLSFFAVEQETTVIAIAELESPIVYERIVETPQLLTQILSQALSNASCAFPALLELFNKPWLAAWAYAETLGYSVANDLFALVNTFGIIPLLNLRGIDGEPVINCILGIPTETYWILVTELLHNPLSSPEDSLCLLLLLARNNYYLPLQIEGFFEKQEAYVRAQNYYRYSYESNLDRGTLPLINGRVDLGVILNALTLRVTQINPKDPQDLKQAYAWVMGVLRETSQFHTLKTMLKEQIRLLSTIFGLDPLQLLSIAKTIDAYIESYKGPNRATLTKIPPFSLLIIAASALSVKNGTQNMVYMLNLYTRFEADVLHVLTNAVYNPPEQPLDALVNAREREIASWMDQSFLSDQSPKPSLNM